MNEIEKLQKDVKTLVRICEIVYKNGHREGCLRGVMCGCGLMHYEAWKDQQK
jgi:hypothetical protein